MQFRINLGDTVEERSERLLLIAIGIVVVLFAAFQISSVFGGSGNVAAKRKELEDARMMASLEPDLVQARRLLQEEVGMAGGTVPAPVIEKMKELYSIETEEGKRRLASVSAAQLRRDLTIDEATADFIYLNRFVLAIDELGQRKRQLFEENRATLDTMMAYKIAQLAGQTGIQKIDQLKVDPPKQTRRGTAKKAAAAPVLRPDSATTTQLQTHFREVDSALAADDAEKLKLALETLVSFAQNDPTIQRAARGDLEKRLDDKSLALTEYEDTAIRAAAIQSQPSVSRIVSNLMKAHFEAALAHIPESATDPASVTYENAPFPAIPSLPRHQQRKLVELMRHNGGMPLSDAQIEEVLKAEAPKPETPEGGEGDNADNDDGDNESVNAEPPPMPEPTNTPVNPAVNPANEEQVAAADDASAEDAKMEEGASDGKEVAEKPDGEAKVEPPKSPEVVQIRAYEAELVRTAWRIADLTQGTRATQPQSFTATLNFKADLGQLVNFIHQLENDLPWMRVTGIRLGIDNADQPSLNVDLTIQADALVS